MVQRVIDALPDEADIYLLVRPEYVSMTRERITRARVVPVHACARGVCETLLSAPVDPRDKVLVVNCDNVILPPWGWDQFFQYENAIVTFREQDILVEPPPFSYVRTQGSIIYEIAEKRRIGQLACAGAFLFADYETLRLLCNWHLAYDPPDYKAEHYLAPAYTRLIDGTNVYSVQLNASDIFVRMGTPSEATEARNYYVHGNTRQFPSTDSSV